MNPDQISARSMLGQTQLSRTVSRCSSSCQAHLTSSSQSLTLADIIQAAPRLLECLPATSKSAISGCSRQLRQLLHASTRTVIIQTCEELEHLSKSQWPQLEMVLAHNWGIYLAGQEIPSNLQTTAVIQLYERQYHVARFQPEGHSAVVIAMTGQSAHSALTVAKLSQTVVDYLKQPQWSHLRHLKLTDSKLSPEGIAQLTSIDWPHLDHLDLSCNQLGTPGIAQLVKGTWPRLSSLNVRQNNLDAEAIRHLVIQDWQLKTLNLADNPLSQCASMRELVQHAWAKLDTLNLHGTGITSQAIADFAQGKWQSVQTLLLGSNGLGRDAMANLALASLPWLCRLALADNKVDAAATQQLVRSDWPLLVELDLNGNCLDDTAMLHLGHGQWLKLRCLLVDSNNITSVGVGFLMHGTWPELSRLSFGAAAVCAETWALLSLDPRCEPYFAGQSCVQCKRVPDKLPLGHPKLWPYLYSV